MICHKKLANVVHVQEEGRQTLKGHFGVLFIYSHFKSVNTELKPSQ